MVRCKSHSPWSRVVQVTKGYLILGSDLISDDDLRNVVELIPVLILLKDVSKEGLKFRTSWNGHIQSFSSVESLLVKQVVVIFIYDV